ncbi:MAG: hypothetical protein HRU41_22890 [Saprospiraceae bacterium]|nr:hypothetical protein [Saprospiraceae bacterium]
MFNALAYCLSTTSTLTSSPLLVAQTTVPDHDIALWLRGSVICVFILFALCGIVLYQSIPTPTAELSDKDVILTEITDQPKNWA